jgi:hypothetical protein
MQVRKLVLLSTPGLSLLGTGAAIVWHNHSLIGALLILLGLMVLVAQLSIKRFGPLKWQQWYRRPSRLIAIEAAACKTYEAVGNTAIDGLVPSGGDFIAARTTCIVIHAATGDVQLFGVEPPSTLHSLIAPNWCNAENLKWQNGNVRLTGSGNGHGFQKIAITNSDLKRHIAWTRGGMRDIAKPAFQN